MGAPHENCAPTFVPPFISTPLHPCIYAPSVCATGGFVYRTLVVHRNVGLLPESSAHQIATFASWEGGILGVPAMFVSNLRRCEIVVVGIESFVGWQERDGGLHAAAQSQAAPATSRRCSTSGRDQRLSNGREKFVVITWLGQKSGRSGAQGGGTKRGIVVGGQHNYARRR